MNRDKYVEAICQLGAKINDKDYEIAGIQRIADERLYEIARLEDKIEKLEKRNQDLSDTKYAMHKAYKELEMDLDSAENEIAQCHKDIKKLNQKINLKNYLIDKLSRAIMLISK